MIYFAEHNWNTMDRHGFHYIIYFGIPVEV